MTTQTQSIGEVFASLDRMRAEDADKARRERELVAELAVLTAFDVHRGVLGHDYGGGQRQAELNRRERPLQAVQVTAAYLVAGVRAEHFPGRTLDEAEPHRPTGDELRAAWDRVAAPRMRRLTREEYRGATPGTRRTLRAWAHTQVWLNAAAAEVQA